MKCKQAFMHGPFDLRIEEVELPALRKDQVLIKLLACICQSDVECFEGKSAEGRYDLGPYTPGHEWVGRVTEVGEEVTSIKVGDKVVGDCVLPCHQCANCKDGKMSSACLNMREVGFRPDSPGGFGEYMILEEACRQWCCFIDDAPERADGEGFAQFFYEIFELKEQEYMENLDISPQLGQDFT